MIPTPELPDPTKSFKLFSEWTDDEIRDRAAELHAHGMVTINPLLPIQRDDDQVVYVPAWIELAAWD